VTTTDLRCPECSSLVRAGMSWCSLCHADVRSEEEKEAARAEAALLVGSGVTVSDVTLSDVTLSDVTLSDVAVHDVTSELAIVDHESPAPTRGRHARPSAVSHEPVPIRPVEPVATGESAGVAGPATSAETQHKLEELKAAGIDVDEMLHMLASDDDSGPLKGLVDRISSKGSRAIAVMIGATVLTVIGFGLMFVLGSIFG
jgi:hypothetical protein